MVIKMLENRNNQRINCCVSDCVHCIDECRCALETIQVSKDSRDENTMYNTICQSYEEQIFKY